MRHFRDMAMRALRRFRRSVEDARHRPEHEELHRLRVRMNRVRSLLRFLSFLDNDVVGPRGAVRRTRELFSAAGAVREIQVNEASLDGLPVPPPVRSPGSAHLRSRERTLRKHLHKALARMRPRDLQRLELHTLRMLGGLSERELRSRARAFIRIELHHATRLARAADVHLHLHAIRKHLKHIVNLFDLVDPGIPRPAGLTATLDALGEWHDAADLRAALVLRGKHRRQRDILVSAAERRMAMLQTRALERTASFLAAAGPPLQRRR